LQRDYRRLDFDVDNLLGLLRAVGAPTALFLQQWLSGFSDG
jgi:hypothetical protein